MKRTVSGIMVTLLLVSVLTFVLNVQPIKANGAIYIRANGSIDPPTAPISSVDNVTYTFMADIYDSIVVERNNIIISGNGYTLQGTGAYPSKGIDLSGRTNVTVRNTQIQNFYFGIYLFGSSNNTITGNSMINNIDGIDLRESSNYNNVTGNNITNNNNYGIIIFSSNNTIAGNNITENGWGILLGGSSNSIAGNTFTNDGLIVASYGNVVKENSVNGKPLVYLEGVSDYTIAYAGQVILVNCSNVRVENLNLSNTLVGLELLATNSSRIANNNISNNHYGIAFYYSSSNNSIIGNEITANYVIGIYLYSSSNNSISGNNITENGGNSTAGNAGGINLCVSSNYNSIVGNNITENNKYGIFFMTQPGGPSGPLNNSIYHNNFIDNTNQVYSSGLVNIWDDGYRSGGNYWSDYTGQDLNGDGIGETSYTIDANNTDRYPIVASINMFDAGTWNGTACNIGLASNSKISNFQLDVAQRIISFNVTGPEFTTGFCRITIPNVIVQDLWQDNYKVLLNGESLPFKNWTDTTNTHIYINYTHSEKQVTIVPEFPSAMILPLFMILTVLIVILTKKKMMKNKNDFVLRL